MPDMAPRTLFVCMLIVLLGSSNSSFAKKKKQEDTPPPVQSTIMEISPMSLTVDLGKDTHQTYNIADKTKITLDGNPVSVDALRAGMLVTVELATDNETALSLIAQDAPRVIKKGRKLGTSNWIMY
jgi:hypothetical protein